MRFVFTVCSLLAILSVSATSLDSLRAEQREEGLVVIHQVEEEETLYSLARRYKTSVSEIIAFNNMEDYGIEIGQIIEILITQNESEEPQNPSTESQRLKGYHYVEQGETLYSIAKKYDLKLRTIKKWNDLQSNAIAPGMSLRVSKEVDITEEVEESQTNEIQKDSVEEIVPIPTSFEAFDNYLVQTGETLYTIASKIGVTIDSLRLWNGLNSDYLKIGQELRFRGNVSDSVITAVQPTKTTRTQIDENGFEKVIEEGVASVIESMNTTRYLALHRSLPIGTKLQIRNLMNNQVVHVKVIGKLPDTGLNKNLLLRLSKPAYEQLGILDPRSRVEVAYFKQ